MHCCFIINDAKKAVDNLNSSDKMSVTEFTPYLEAG